MAHNAMGRLLRCQPPSYLRSINFTQRRSWSSRTIPSLNQTSSTELNETLNRFRDELFIPHSLNTNQRNLIYKKANAHKLTGHPIMVTIGENEEPYQLRPLNVTKLPTRKDTLRVLELMAEYRDWSNLVTFLTGVYKSGRALQLKHWEWLVRKAGSTRGYGYLVSCAQQANKTHFKLNEVSLVDRLFFDLHLRGVSAEFKGHQNAGHYAETFSSLMETPEHAVHDLEKDPKRSPLVIGTLLEFSASKALNKYQGVDQERMVEPYARRLLAAWKNQDVKTEGKDWYAIDHLLQTIAPSYNGIKFALQLDSIQSNNNLAPALKAKANEFGMLVTNLQDMAPENVKENPTVGLYSAKLVHEMHES